MFQKIYDVLKDWRAPEWFSDLMAKIESVIIGILVTVGQAYLESLKNKIIEVAKESITPEEKFKKVFSYARNELGFSYLKDSTLNLLIESVYNALKADGEV